MNHGWTIALVLVLIAGAVRLVWVGTWNTSSTNAGRSSAIAARRADEPYPWLGMPTSYAYATWRYHLIFIALSADRGNDATGLAWACQMLNVAAVLLVVVFAFHGAARAAANRGSGRPRLCRSTR